ncbi:MAG TPA: hypothetical protein PKO05_04600 [Thermoanaerobaculia bacterium]|nr:MAG: hypothetical protein BWX64_00644 [Acidobacteria bacterium ADurb.Bin051]HNU82691.1 hypothetical protein [Thermoanaerobaculia bacterium]
MSAALVFDPRAGRAPSGSPPPQDRPALPLEERILAALTSRPLGTAELALEVGAPPEEVYQSLGRLLAERRITTDSRSRTFALAPRAVEAESRSEEDAQGRAERALLTNLAGGPARVGALLRGAGPAGVAALAALEAAGIVAVEDGFARIVAAPEQLARLGLERYAPGLRRAGG